MFVNVILIRLFTIREALAIAGASHCIGCLDKCCYLSQSCHEFLAVYDEAGVFAFADEALFVRCGNRKLQLTPLYGGEGSGGSDGAAMSRGL